MYMPPPPPHPTTSHQTWCSLQPGVGGISRSATPSREVSRVKSGHAQEALRTTALQSTKWPAGMTHTPWGTGLIRFTITTHYPSITTHYHPLPTHYHALPPITKKASITELSVKPDPLP
jgi:hypothetical protein